MAGWPSLIIEADVDAADVDAPLGQLPGNHSFFDIEPNDPLWLVVTLTSALVLLALTLCVYLSARQCSRFYGKVFAPRVELGAAGAAAFPGVSGVYREWRATCHAVSNCHAGLEAAMMQRFILLQL